MIKEDQLNDVVIGAKVTITSRTRYTSGSKQYKQDITFDFTGATLKQILLWAASERVIKFQSALRNMESEELFDAFMEVGDELDVHAVEAHLPPDEHMAREDFIKSLMETLKQTEE